MRTGLFTNAAIATVFVVPALTLQGEAPARLETSLERTLVALETLKGLGRSVEGGGREAVGALIASTEPALPDARQRDELLETLRHEVSALERELDGLHASEREGPAGGARPPALQGLPGVAPTQGLDEATRRSLEQPRGARARVPAPNATNAGEAPAAPDAAPEKLRFEPSGYTADALTLARALYRKGEWLEALALLEGRDERPAETYWRARCLEKLERNTEAVAAYEAVIARPDGGWEAKRAKEDLDFLRWRMKFSKLESRRAAGGGSR